MSHDAILHINEFIPRQDRKSTRLNSSHLVISYAVFCLKKKTDHLSQRASTASVSHPRATTPCAKEVALSPVHAMSPGRVSCSRLRGSPLRSPPRRPGPP